MLEIAVFVSGAVVMIFELAGSRILAPYLGTSLYVWTSIIGIILGSLSIGYWLGGKLADKNPSLKQLSLIIFFNGLCIGLAGIIKDPLLTAAFPVMRHFTSVFAIVSSLILFAPASILAGLVSPYAVRLKIDSVGTSGKTVGNLYAISTIGSIAGTFFAGFFLIPTFGTSNIVFGLAITLIILSLVAYRQDSVIQKSIAIAAFALLILVPTPITKPYVRADIIDIDTRYNRLWLHQITDEETGKPVLLMQTDFKGAQSGRFLDSNEPVFDYMKYYQLAEYFNPKSTKSLMLGGAAYTYPSYFLEHYPKSSIDVAEIDPGMTEVAKKYFHLDAANPRLRIFHEDARIYMNNTTEKYDAIYSDVFASTNIPHQMTTVETAKQMSSILNENGVVMLNIISGIEGKRGKFLRAEIATFKSVFPQVYLFPVKPGKDSQTTQNVMLVASKNPSRFDFKTDDKQLQTMLDARWVKPIEDDMPILTDDFSPVEYYHQQAL
ncbi:fused MFS/spermidine synthase [Candidatus Falkowbacteria bacterium]|nr:fused MFS/spermidine synthase [Candidatus Falkowbacteria bacterium]